MKFSKEPKSMSEVREWRRKTFAKAKGKTLSQKLDWISKHAKMFGKPYVDPLQQFKKASKKEL